MAEATAKDLRHQFETLSAKLTQLEAMLRIPLVTVGEAFRV